jgi:hypothetical protein
MQWRLILAEYDQTPSCLRRGLSRDGQYEVGDDRYGPLCRDVLKLYEALQLVDPERAQVRLRVAARKTCA